MKCPASRTTSLSRYPPKPLDIPSALMSGLKGPRSIKIVALGPSSISGEAESAISAPAGNGSETKYDGRNIAVLNRGKSGGEAPGELARLQEDVVAENRALVVWQVGTNAVWQSG